MGCFESKPQLSDNTNGNIFASKAGSKKSQLSVAEPPPLPDFGVKDHFQVIKLLGEGGSGQTWLCTDNDDGKQVAIKFIQRPIPKVVVPMIFAEIRIQAELGEGHVNLVQAREVLVSPTHLGLVMEYVSGGNLTAYVTSKWDTTQERNGLFLTEDEARYFFKQFLGALEYLHARRVAHRDIKLDNIVMDDSKPPRIKLCDFGFAKNWDSESNMYTQIGTPVYMSPQLISSKSSQAGYDATKADVWACGVLLFVMLLGMFPYDHTEHPDPNSSGAHIEVWLQQIKGSWREGSRVASFAAKLSDPCRDLLDKVFEHDEKKRIDILGIKQHPWYLQPIAEAYNKGLQDLGVDQSQIDYKVDSGMYQSKERDDALKALVDLAGTSAASGDTSVSRINLTRIQSKYSIARKSDLDKINCQTIEEESLGTPRSRNSPMSLFDNVSTPGAQAVA